MAEDRDRSKRYANSPKAKHGKMQDKGEQKAEGEAKSAEAKEGAGKGPTDKAPGSVGKVGEDKGPEGSPSPEFGVIAKRQKSEHSEMRDRHSKEMTDMVSRHHKEMQDGMETAAAGKADASAGSPKELGKDKSEGEKGSEP